MFRHEIGMMMYLIADTLYLIEEQQLNSFAPLHRRTQNICREIDWKFFILDSKNTHNYTA